MVFESRYLLRLLAVLLMVLPALQAPPALANNGNSQAGNNDNGSANGNSNGNGSVNGNGNGGSSADGDGDGDHSPTLPADESATLPADDETPEISDEDRALGAVNARVALPLTNILDLARRQSGGEFIDAELLVVDGKLVYDVTLLEAGGRLTHLYYAARTGSRMVPR